MRTLVIGARALALFLCSSTERCTIIKCSLCYAVCLNLLAIHEETALLFGFKNVLKQLSQLIARIALAYNFVALLPIPQLHLFL